MTTATFHGQVIAHSEHTVCLEGTQYFPPESVAPGTLAKSWLRAPCYWKGIARYQHVCTGEHRSTNAAWSYPLPSPLAWKIKGYVAFDPGAGVVVSGDRP